MTRLLGSGSSSGATVTEDRMLSLTAVWLAVRVIAETLATVPLKIYESESGSRERDEVREGALYDTLMYPNEEQTAVEWREMWMGFCVLRGTSYAEIVFGQDGQPDQIWPVPFWRCTPDRNTANGRLRYRVTYPSINGRGSGTFAYVPPERMLVLRGFSRDGLLGDDPMWILRDMFGTALSTETHSAKYFANDATPAGVLSHPNSLKAETKELIARGWREMYGGVDNRYRVAVLDEGVTFQSIMTDPEKSQLIEARGYNVLEVARYTNIPPPFLMDLSRATFSNIEHMAIQLVTNTLRPWAVRSEAVLSRRLLLPRERSTVSIEHNLEGLLRGDMAARFQSYAAGRQWGIYSANDVRWRENLPPIEGGDIYLSPINMVPADAAYDVLPDSGASGSEDRSLPASRRALPRPRETRAFALRKRTEASYVPVFRQRFNEMVRRETKQVRRALGKATDEAGVSEFEAWMVGFFEEQASFWAVQSLPMFRSLGEAVYGQAADEVNGGPEVGEDFDTWMDGYAESFGEGEANSSYNQITAIMRDAPDPLEGVAAVEQRLDEWDEKRADKMAGGEVVDLGAAVAILAWANNGVQRKRWRANSGACPLCQQMDGRVTDLGSAFLRAGDSVEPDDEETAPLSVGRTIGHPRLHGGCECGLVPDF